MARETKKDLIYQIYGVYLKGPYSTDSLVLQRAYKGLNKMMKEELDALRTLIFSADRFDIN